MTRHYGIVSKAGMTFIFVSLGLIAISKLSAGVEVYDYLESMVSKEKLPRILNTDDLEDFHPNDPQPLFSPVGDFNGDEKKDLAISGIYDLPGEGPKYFLLVATLIKPPNKFKELYFNEFHAPVYLYKPGTTGEGDPGDQAFSISLCSQCSEGHDFFWDDNTQTFTIKKWTAQEKRFQVKQTVPAEEIPEDLVEQALEIVGKLEDVRLFVKELKARGGELVTRVEAPQSKRKNRYWVKIIERIEGEDILYDRILVDIKKAKILKRTLK